VLYPQALDKDLAEMLSVVTPKKQVKGHNNLEQQIAELKEVFAVYDEDGTGQLEQAEFVEAIVSAGLSPTQAVCTHSNIQSRVSLCMHDAPLLPPTCFGVCHAHL